MASLINGYETVKALIEASYDFFKRFNKTPEKTLSIIGNQERSFFNGHIVQEQAASMERIEVTDLYEAFYRVMALIWGKPDFRTQDPQKVPSFADYWYDLEAYLHENLFIAACARRPYKSTGLELSAQQIQKHLEVCDSTGRRRPGNSGIYYGSGFDWGKPMDETVEPLVIAADMVGSNLEDTRLFLTIE